MKILKYLQYLQLSQAQLIKLSIITFLIISILILYLETISPPIVSIHEIEEFPLRTPISVIATFEVNFESPEFSVLTLTDIENSSYTTTAIIQTNASLIDSTQMYRFSGKVSSFRGQKQLDSYTMQVHEE